MAAASLRSALLSPAAALRRLSPAPRAPLFAQPKRFDGVRRFFPAAASMSTSSGTKEAPDNNPGLQAKINPPPPPPPTKGYFMQQTMFCVKDPKVSFDFYSRVMGMSLLKRLDFPDMKFSLYFLGYEDLSAAPADPVKRTVKRTEWTFGQKATIELTHMLSVRRQIVLRKVKRLNILHY
ncbi:lactoylglutathione lyase-like [Lolium perenne]|uniref:lactoylglutathione lyase-like n=1 Tax=Lolium perenne TaxID=4522 RepID=UPI003A99ABC1